MLATVYCQIEASNLEKNYLEKFEGSFHKDNIWYSWYGYLVMSNPLKWMLDRILHDINNNSRDKFAMMLYLILLGWGNFRDMFPNHALPSNNINPVKL